MSNENGKAINIGGPTDMKERLNFGNRTFLITGGATGIGRDIGGIIRGLDGNLIVSTRSSEHYKDTVSTLGTEGVYPFIGDLRDQQGMQASLKDLSDQGVVPTDIVLSHAGGIDKIYRDLIKAIGPLRDAPEDVVQSRLAQARATITDLVAGQMDYTRGVNFESSVAVVEAVAAKRSSVPRNIVFISSLLSTFYGVEGFAVPSFYQGVAQTKNLFEQWMAENAQQLMDNNVYPTIVTAHLVPDSKTGFLLTSLRRYYPAFNPDLSLLPTTRDVSNEVINVLSTDPTKAVHHPVYRYIVGTGDVRNELSPNDKAFFKIPI